MSTEFRLFGLTFRLEVVIICVILGILLGSHLLCSCCRYPISSIFGGLVEGYSITANDKENVKKATNDIINANQQIQSQSVQGFSSMEGSVKEVMSKLSEGLGLASSQRNKDGSKGVVDVEPRQESIAEGMATIGSSLGEMNNGDVAASWITKATSYSSDFGYMDRNRGSVMEVGTPVPLPEGELFFFANNKFKPECCPGPYSTSTGCACMSKEQINYLNTRGGNRTSDSEF
jgi:hypothetical protein